MFRDSTSSPPGWWLGWPGQPSQPGQPSFTPHAMEQRRRPAGAVGSGPCRLDPGVGAWIPRWRAQTAYHHVAHNGGPRSGAARLSHSASRHAMGFPGSAHKYVGGAASRGGLAQPTPGGQRRSSAWPGPRCAEGRRPSTAPLHPNMSKSSFGASAITGSATGFSVGLPPCMPCATMAFRFSRYFGVSLSCQPNWMTMAVTFSSDPFWNAVRTTVFAASSGSSQCFPAASTMS
mmetsp:Transcript_85818/g.220905  ORF Transcript_85818/g.220905 Transcript_85818/m.220905 type:complete len:232 (+) Transcript_85818:56-751(+)